MLTQYELPKFTALPAIESERFDDHRIKYFDLTLFRSIVKQDIESLNQLSYEYKSCSSNDSLEKLRQIKTAYESICAKYHTTPLSIFPGYEEELAKFYDYIHTQSKLLNADLFSLPKGGANILVDFGDFIADMNYQDAREFTTILLDTDNFKSKLVAFAKKNPPLLNLLSKYKISYLGGANSKNYLIQSQDGESFVLKLNHNFGYPKKAAHHLQNAGTGSFIAKRFQERQVKTQKGYYDLMLTDYCAGKDVYSYISNLRKQKSLSDDEKQNQILLIFQQMAKALVEIDNLNLAFTDMKSENWLVDDKGRVWIMDTKSFLPTDAKKNISSPHLQQNGYRPGVCIRSRHCLAPELISFTNSNTDFSADKAHVYMLGLNINEFLNPSSILSFPEELSQLCHYALQTDINNRASMSECLKILNQIIISQIEGKIQKVKTQAENPFQKHILDLGNKILEQPDNLSIDNISEFLRLYDLINSIQDKQQNLAKLNLLDCPAMQTIIKLCIESHQNVFENQLKSYQNFSEAYQIIMAAEHILTKCHRDFLDPDRHKHQYYLEAFKNCKSVDEITKIQEEIKQMDPLLRSCHKEINGYQQNLHLNLNITNDIRTKLNQAKNLAEIKKTASDIQLLNQYIYDCRDTFFKIGNLKISENDILIDKFIDKSIDKIEGCNSIQALKEIHQEIKNTYTGLSESKILKTLSATIEDLRSRNGCFSIGVIKKVKHIQSLVEKISLEDRQKEIEDPCWGEVIKALNTKRYGFKLPFIHQTTKTLSFFQSSYNSLLNKQDATSDEKAEIQSEKKTP